MPPIFNPDSPSDDPLSLFHNWLAEAEEKEINDPTGMALATADAQGRPSLRMVLLKGADDGGFTFYTNVESRKGEQLTANPNAALLFHWKSLRRQVRVEGPVSVATPEQADAYFESRPRQSRIGAWASQQSRPLESRFALEKSVARFAAKYATGAVPRPPYWTGFRVAPLRIEFWQDGAFRLHDRALYSREEEGQAWQKQRLYP
ncbi:pyridoxamine 5'-phosphate oxidase [Aquibaculum sediminis]|uniref:pyridoxamine 5'-phosphate oxidase n=1 Tax=Aquibaculum sediminis TaxID=3231907 RepID=UPI003455DC52